MDVFKKNLNSIDLVISDLGLPKMSGTECMVLIKRLKPSQKIVMASGYFTPEDRQKLSELGITHFLQKPYNPSLLLQTLRQVLDHY